MKLTNRLNLPDALYRAAKKVRDAYDRGPADISVTGLDKPPRQVILEMLHEEELTEDLCDVIYSVLGSALHVLLEKAHADDAATERRLFAKMDGWTISGAMDVYEGAHVQDWKLTTVYKVKNNRAPDEWHKQLNGYAWLLRENGLPIQSAEVVCFYRDWKKTESFREWGYPKHQVARIPIPIWSPEEAEAYVHQRVLLHQAALHDLPLCTPEERWEKPSRWAIKKTGASKAINGGLHETHASALEHLKKLGDGHFIERRPGEATKCTLFCAARPFCTQAAGDEGEKNG